MDVHSSGILLYRFKNNNLEAMLIHPGGPFWLKKDKGAWSIPKGITTEGEDLLEAAKRELKEETEFDIDGQFIELGELKQPSGKIIHIWTIEKDIDVSKLKSNTFLLEWPKNSGNFKEYPEVNKGEWFPIDIAKEKILKGQRAFLDRLMEEIKKSKN